MGKIASIAKCTLPVALVFQFMALDFEALAQCDGQATFTDTRDNIVYNQVTIGTQCWMAENLNHGTFIHSCTGGTSSDGEQTDNGTIEKYCNGCTSGQACNAQGDCSVLGGLYQWDEAMQYVTTNGAQGICPTGWHIPTDNEWKTMEMNLGMTQLQADATGIRGSTEGDQIKAVAHCFGGTNCGITGFDGLMSGNRSSTTNACQFYGATSTGAWFTSTAVDATSVWHRQAPVDNAGVFRMTTQKSQGMAIRCLRDIAAWPLPVELLYFKAEWTNENYETATLEWETSSEINNDRFEIERSIDAINFEFVKSVSGAGNSTEKIAYKTLDEEPYKNGTSYYRLKQVDNNGDYKYSNIETLNILEGLSIVNVYPNPTINELTVLLTSSEALDIKVSIKNNLGQELRLINQKVEIGLNSLNLQASELSAGNYFVEITTKDGLHKIERKFIKTDE